MSAERRPTGPGWTDITHRLPAIPALSLSGWTDGAILVISAIADMTAPDASGDVIPQWHVSITDRGARPGAAAVHRALAAFDMLGAEEDNHHPGQARNFFLPVDPARRVDCECKATEQTIRERDGYTWTNPIDGPCRGCELERVLGRPCPIHRCAMAPRPCEVRR